MNSSIQSHRVWLSLLAASLMSGLMLAPILIAMPDKLSDAVAVGEARRLQVVLLEPIDSRASEKKLKSQKLESQAIAPKGPADAIGSMVYLPVSQLTERPVVVNDIDAELSDRFAGVRSQSLMLVLLINEYGDVDKVLMDGGQQQGALPSVLMDELRQRFLEARFLPGRRYGRPVRCALRIAVMLN